MTPAKTIMLPLWMVIACISSQGQYRFERPVFLNTGNGLPTNEIRAIGKAPDGFMWIATMDGLCRFDGLQVRRYIHDSTRNSIASNEVNAVLPLEKEVWAGHNRGISVLSINTDTFRHYQLSRFLKSPATIENSVTALKRSTKYIWIGTRRLGLWRYDFATQQFKRIAVVTPDTTLRPLLGTSDQVLSIETSKTSDSIVWAGTPGGLIEVDVSTGVGVLHAYAFADKQLQVASNAFRRLYYHENGLLYVGTWAAGMNVFDPHSKKYSSLKVLEHKAREILTSAVSAIYPHSRDEFWITCGKGLILYNTKLNDATWTRENSQTDQRFYGVDLVDERSRLWHFNINGIQYFDPQLQQLASYGYEHLFGKNWAFTFFIAQTKYANELVVCPNNTDGIYTFNQHTEQWRRYKFNRPDSPRIVRGFARLANGDLLLSSYEGMFRFNWRSKTLDRLRVNAPVQLSRFGAMVLDRNENAWISIPDEGLLFWDMKADTFKLLGHVVYKISPNAFENIQHVFCDSRNNIWFAHRKGFGVVVSTTRQVILFEEGITTENYVGEVQDFAEDNMGRIWFTGTDGKLGYANVALPHQGILHAFKATDYGLTGDVVQLASDLNGTVWGYTSRELFHIGRTGSSISVYSLKYGLDAPDFYHFSFSPKNEVLFGGRTKILVVDPLKLKLNSEMARPYINEVELLGKQKSIGAYGLDEVKLHHTERNIAISFSALAYTLNREIRFRYRLVGVHDWSVNTEKRSVNYTNLKGGKYLFEVQAANNEGHWNPQSATLMLQVGIPWWETNIFYISALLAVVLMLYAAYRNRISAIHRKQKLQSDYEKRLAVVEMSALRAQMNPHFLFNSLNSIDSYIIKNESKKASEYLNNFARLIRLILHNSKSNLIPLKDEIETLDLYLQMEALRFGNKFDYTIYVAEDIDPAQIQIPPMLIQPYVENAIWHGIMHQENGTRGRVEIRLFLKNEALNCTIEDNGIGRKKAMQLAAMSTGPKRKSMGMQITRERMEILNKLHKVSSTIDIEDLAGADERPRGTKVTIVIPFTKINVG